MKFWSQMRYRKLMLLVAIIFVYKLSVNYNRKTILSKILVGNINNNFLKKLKGLKNNKRNSQFAT